MPAELNGCWDTVLAVEFIEHTTQERVEETLSLLEKVARRRIILSTPNVPYYLRGGETFLGFNPFEAHISYVPAGFFHARGYSIIPAAPPRWRSDLRPSGTPAPTYVAVKDIAKAAT
jgi:hypothetical protein